MNYISDTIKTQIWNPLVTHSLKVSLHYSSSYSFNFIPQLKGGVNYDVNNAIARNFYGIEDFHPDFLTTEDIRL